MQKITLQEALTTGRGTERSFCCPVHDDSNASASVNVVKGVWYCYACHAKGTTEDHVPSPEDVIRVLAGEVPPRTYPETWLDLFDAREPSPYWSQRFGEEVASKHRCGTHFETGVPTYPIRYPNGDLVGVVTRQTEGKSKYLYPSGIRTSGAFYGEYKPSNVFVLVEGAADVMAIDQSGIPDGWTILGCFGSGLHMPQIQLIADYAPKVVIAAFDNDSAGYGAIERAKHQLLDIAPVLSHSWGNVNANDPGDAPVEQRIESLCATLLDSPYGKYK
ncbi:Bacterial DnaG primase, TOPRIM domain [uncultured Caudovirales phage]|uniref:Bacterial DnaG primase, TOPRIM domain n=1 Tax=uncultured Caudovirales phage TaxID=2100421 RepID=A0A6J5RRV5_9CAUD|nr:Bacterial DnaG primase, TOPRIM domain [uncultured Caudovirales phage]